jgi:alginate O-acetyltransferase complex protein AlgI
MLFNSLTFVVFFTLVLAMHALPLSWTAKKRNLLIASYIFYAAWNPPFVILVWLSTIVDWHVAKAMYVESVQSRRRLLLTVSILVNLGLLAFFKYGNFLLENFQVIVGAFGFDYQPAQWSIILPVGISFYTFQTMAYSLDVYLKRARPARSFLDFALFVTFFPQLVAGPIVRPTHLIPQFAVPGKATRDQLLWGLGLVTLGLFMKIVIADGALASTADLVYGEAERVATLDAWLGTLAFSGQIFCDFAGYSTTAIGVALCLGFSLPNNFRFPYAAIGFSDFWKRWHISLSSWLRDYLYIPLGGNRKGNIRTYVNLMLTMLIGGLWHGASWTFVVWGGLHGLYLAVERWILARWGKAEIGNNTLVRILLALLTYFLVNITWVFFRAQDFATAWRILSSMLFFGSGDKVLVPTVQIIEVSVVIVGLVTTHWLMRDRTLESVVSKVPPWLLATVWAALIWMVIVTQGSADSFIYFQF